LSLLAPPKPPPSFWRRLVRQASAFVPSLFQGGGRGCSLISSTEPKKPLLNIESLEERSAASDNLCILSLGLPIFAGALYEIGFEGDPYVGEQPIPDSYADYALPADSRPLIEGPKSVDSSWLFAPGDYETLGGSSDREGVNQPNFDYPTFGNSGSLADADAEMLPFPRPAADQDDPNGNFAHRDCLLSRATLPTGRLDYRGNVQRYGADADGQSGQMKERG
jgi:hypothetical protein